jgi:riboflavin synthase
MWCIDLLLGEDLETNETTVVAMQRRSKHVSTIIKLLLETVFATRSMQRGYKEDNWGTQSLESSL